MEEAWFSFRERYADLFALLSRSHPRFWTDLAELEEMGRRSRDLPGGIRVPGRPDTRDSAVQTEEDWLREGRHHTALEAELRERGTQTERPHMRDVRVGADYVEGPGDQPLQLGPTRGRGRIRPLSSLPGTRSLPPAPPARPTRTDRCWSCRERGHLYTDCPLPRGQHTFCYGCGRPNVTLKECQDCGPEWENMGPYGRRTGRASDD